MSLFDLLEGNPTSATPLASAAPPPAVLAAGSAGGFQDAPAATTIQKVQPGFAPDAVSAPAALLGGQSASPFALEPVDVENVAEGNWCALAVSNNILLLAQDKPAHRCVRIHLDGQAEMDDIEFEQPKKSPSPPFVRAIYLDPTGRHALLSCADGLAYYLGAPSKRARPLAKLRNGGSITGVAWNKDVAPDSPSSGSIVVATGDGALWELIFEHVEDERGGFFSRKGGGDPLKFIKQIAALSPAGAAAATAAPSAASPAADTATFLFLDAFPADVRKYILYVATASGRFLQFIGSLRSAEPGSLEDLLAAHKPWQQHLAPAPLPPDAPRLPTVSADIPVYSGSSIGTPRRMAWLTADGVFLAPISMGSQQPGDCVFDSPVTYSLDDDTADDARGIITLKYHLAILGAHGIHVVSSLIPESATDESGSSSSRVLPVVWSVHLPEPVLAVSHDVMQGTVWAVTRSQLYELVVKDEDRDIWKVYLAQNKFEQAAACAKTQDQRDRIAAAQADHYFDSRRFVLSAKYYAQAARVPFEQVTLKFIASGELEALRVYLDALLKAKVRATGPARDAVQVTMLATWLLELHLEHLNEFSADAPAAQADPREREILEASVREFLSTYHAHLDPKTVRQLCISYNRSAELVHFFKVTGDHARLLDHWIEHRDWDAALAVLERQIDPEIFYRFVPLLLDQAPARVVRILMAQGTQLDASRLLPAFIKSGGHAAVARHAIAYLEHAVLIQRRTDPELHNFLIQLYAQAAATDSASDKDAAGSSGADETKLLTFLRATPRHYALDHALRTCLAHKRMEATIFLFTELDQAAEAIRLSLARGDVANAMALARDATTDPDELRTHWLAIAAYLAERGEHARLLRLVRGSAILRLDDVFPLFPDSLTSMDDFRDDLVAVLEDYARDLAALETNMDASFRSLHDLKQRASTAPPVVVDPAAPCPVCHQPLAASAAADPFAPNGNGNGGVLGSASSIRTVGAASSGGLASAGTGRKQKQAAAARAAVPGAGWMAFGCHHVVHTIPCATAGASDCPVCGDALLAMLDAPFHDPLDDSWSIV
ncbi:tethering complex subunit [Blastocladiella emersonii ATCC 22665]|nr:tethering complex subunit [Blastocladiella emersonii ATCC 22665]